MKKYFAYPGLCLLLALLGCSKEQQNEGMFKKTYLTANNLTVGEGEKSIEIDYSLKLVRNEDTVLYWFTLDGTAKSSEGDYEAQVEQKLVIPAGRLIGERLVVRLNDDLLSEDNEYFRVVIKEKVSFLADEQEIESNLDREIMVIIKDNDEPPHLTLDDVTVSEADGQVSIHYSLSTSSGQETGFLWQTEDGTATSNSGDYAPRREQWESIPAGQNSGTLTMPISDDLFDELDEDFKVVTVENSLSGIMAAGGGRVQAMVTIIDDDTPPTISIEDVSVREGQAVATIRYSLSLASGKQSSFRWSTRDGIAKSRDGDYVAVSNQQVDIPAGTTGGTLSIDLGNDPDYEGQEYFEVVISDRSLSEIQESGSKLVARVTIEDDENPPTLTVSDITVSEDSGRAEIEYRLSFAMSRDSSFSWFTRDGSAKSGEGDYTSMLNQRVTIRAGRTQGTLSVPVLRDQLYEGKNEQFQVIVENPSDVSKNGSKWQGTVTISDSDPMPSISIADIRVAEEVGEAVIHYTLDHPSAQESSFLWFTEDGTALQGEDYSSHSHSSRVLVGPHSNSGSFSVSIRDDDDYEIAEYFIAKISSSSLRGLQGRAEDLQARVTIQISDRDRRDEFLQSEYSVPIDILWVMDNSGSMSEEQRDLADNFSEFIDDFTHQSETRKNLDFNMAIITTDSHANRVSSSSPLNLSSLLNGKDDFIEKFKEKIKVGTGGNQSEKGFYQSDRFLDEANWLRNDAYLAIIYVSDEDDQSFHPDDASGRPLRLQLNESVQRWVNELQEHKDNGFNWIKIYSIVAMRDRGFEEKGQRYLKASEVTEGRSANINDDFADTLQNFGQDIYALANSFPLSSRADKDTVVVTVDGVVLDKDQWSYSERDNALRFTPESTPAIGAEIIVTYETY